MNDPARQLAALAQHGGIVPLPTDFIGQAETRAYLDKAVSLITISDPDLARLTGSYVADSALAQAEALDDDDVFLIGNDQALLVVFAATIEALRRSILDAAYANRAGAQPQPMRSPEAPSASVDPPSNN